ncbi:MAG: S8 family peptidase [Chitinophagaceae bacterium]|nr:S8 family peptidase [Chitinophagaceae bacterium]
MNKNFKSSALFIVAGFVSFALQAQEVPKGWHMMDKASSGYYGISIDKAYNFVKTKKLKSNTVIVAVIDSGIDTLHEDLKPVLWRNPKEIPGNGIDDDNNGYVDDVYGWNFLGGRDGQNVEQDSYEAARVYHNLKGKYAELKDVSMLSGEELFYYEMWVRAKQEIVGDVNPMEIIQIRRMSKMMVAGDSVIRKAIKKEEYNCKDLESFTTEDADAIKVKDILIRICEGNDNNEITNQQILDQLEADLNKMEASDIAPKNYRANIVKDNYKDFNDKFYGNNNVMVSNKSALHGTHVSGIIGAARGNGKGMDGVADNVKIMTLRAVPDGDEHDKDIALAIHYAVDNGAQVINMSFGKGFSPEKKWVDDAVKYAESKGVLMVHAAGNDAKNLDTSFNYPTPIMLDESRPNNWITVGASGDPKAGGLTASFSNYGKKEVDVFAPGVKIYATVPGGNTYQNLQGTSMASPVVAGLAAMILEYFPTLSAAQVKMVIEKSSQNPGIDVNNPGTDEMVNLSELSKAGGIINAYEAVKLASTLKGERNTKADSKVSPKTKD